ncbi:SusD/RagB family nutrient-binding outer membrane lipoprotein [Mucilaginibacter sp. RS28]|uniref:SusD/RagB family nutrient-binding outer membrane lipoprotein n=1 Tax=Mucilaginibacter straminoryzae TaxID=2932774 RepID=A0A9X2BAV4_9SPHI|nr:SusD/RagB family nutrient-binding outer membrane lipoprotein [Mucilaginibacter straminoryzae]MCJ8211801.1 SusD/RagB family nutrient-binding outer membrane lipoprotein [Mucilaginibacter straminoryzae]
MKTNIKKYTKVLLMVAVTLGAASCKKGYFYDGINNDPTQLQKPIPTNLLPGIIQSTGYEWGGDASRFTSIFMQQVTGAANQSYSATNYSVSSDDVDNMWSFGLYGGIMNNANAMVKLADANGQAHYAAIGRILLANALGLTTDLWGDIPYSQAFQGNANLQPKYDSQQQIYTTIDNLLTTAITQLAASENSIQPGSDDKLYSGDLTKWTKFAHSLRAKFFLHLAKVDASNYSKAITEAQSGFTSSNDDAVVNFSETSVNTENPWSQFNSQRGDIEFTGYIYDLLNKNGDPRLDVYSDGGGGLGALYGNSNSPVYLMSYDELQFIIAEAQFQTGNKQAAATAYNAGVAANLGRTVGSSTYAATVAKTSGSIALNDIMTQKYIANFLNPEVWTDWRRTGLPALTPAAGGVLNGQIPRSLLYPSGEQRYNTNTPPNTGGMLRRVWWDK